MNNRRPCLVQPSPRSGFRSVTLFRNPFAKSALGTVGPLAALAGMASLGVACLDAVGSAPSPSVTSTGQGVVVSASGLVGPLGCGVQSSQVFKYVAVLRGAAIGGDAVGTFDCFADAAFANLSISADGTKTVSLSIRAFNKQSYEALGAATWAGLTPEKALVLPAPWTTECSAVPLRGVRVLAQCPPLQPSADAGVMDAGSSSDADAGLADAADATASDADSASTDGASDGASDGSDAAAQDANGQDASDGAPNG